MKSNLGKTDATIRIVLGILIIIAGVTMESWWGALGAIPIITAFINWCPIYAATGINTCERK